MLIPFIYFILSFPDFEERDHFKNISRMIIVTLCLVNYHLYIFNNYVF